MKKEKLNMCEIINFIFIIVVILYLFLSLIKSVVNPIDVISGEKRHANKYNYITLSGYIDKTVQDNIEGTLSDQLLLSSTLRKVNNYSKGYLTYSFFTKHVSDDELKYYYYDDLAFYEKNSLVYPMIELNEVKDGIDKKILNYNKLMSDYNNVDYYFYYIERDTDIDFNSNNKNGVFEYIDSKVNTSNVARFEIDNYKQFSKYFYKTDHHWNNIGSYKGYVEVLDLLGLSDDPCSYKIVDYDVKWSGSKARTSIFNKVLAEGFSAYIYNYPSVSIKINGKNGDYGNQDKQFAKKFTSDNLYEIFYGSDYGEIVFSTGNEDKDSILIIGESFDNAILKVLASHFNYTISIDLRNYEHDMNKNFSIGDYLKKYNINKVLFIGNINFYNSDDFLIGGK